ncbi:hypothetical protein [Blastococcus sp. SYSU D00695]
MTHRTHPVGRCGCRSLLPVDGAVLRCVALTSHDGHTIGDHSWSRPRLPLPGPVTVPGRVHR